jgi:subtilisin family serine protease
VTVTIIFGTLIANNNSRVGFISVLAAHFNPFYLNPAPFLNLITQEAVMIKNGPKLMGVILLTCALVVVVGGFGLLGEAQAAGKGEAKVVSQGGYASLATKAQRVGSVRTIVQVQAAFTTEPALSKSQAVEQRSAISRAQDGVMAELSAAGLKPVDAYKYKYIPFMAMTVDAPTLDTLLASPGVVSVTEDVPEYAIQTPGWSMPVIGATTMHTAGISGTAVSVAVLDTGVDKAHPYLAGAVVSEACYSTTDKAQGASSLCPKGLAETEVAGSGMPYVHGCPSGACDHGTHVAGIIAGRSGVNGSPGPGVAPEANIIAVQVFSKFVAGQCPSGKPCAASYPSDQIKGLERVYELRDNFTIASVNMSLGGGEYFSACDVTETARKAAIDNLRAAGIATVIASGNDGFCGSMGTPACISTAVSVGATQIGDSVASYSNSASFLSLLAPGSDIDSSIPKKKYGIKSGTSMATPHVAGSWALMRQNHYSITVLEVLNAFTSTGQSVTDNRPGCGGTVTKQRINVAEAYATLGAVDTSILTVTMEGKKKGTVTEGGFTSTHEFTCTTSPCHWLYETGTEITLTAQAPKGVFLDEWSGCTSVTADDECVVTMDQARHVTAIFNPPPKMSVAPKSINFGTVKIGTTPSPIKKITVKNTGTSTLEDIGFVRTGDTQFAIDPSSTCNKTLTKGQSCYIYVTFTPDGTTSPTGSLVVSSNDPDPKKATITVSLKGTGKN